MKKHLPTILVVVMLFVGFAFLFYPDFSTWWNSRIQAGVVDQYREAVQGLSQEQIDRFFARAYEHNAELAALPPTAPLLIAQMAPIPEDYNQILRVGNVMAQIRIPKIDVNLPIFHTTHSNVLDLGVGHLEGTAFPTGGYGNHSVLTAHSGLANARLFTDLEGNIQIGDLFFIDTLDRTLAYQVDEIHTVLPHEIERLRVNANMDLVTLITCTPYALNTHRLLVRGFRVPYDPVMIEEIVVETVSNRVDNRVYIFLGFFALFMLGFMVYQIITSNKRANPIPEMPPVPVYPMEPPPVPVEPMPIYEAPLRPAAAAHDMAASQQAHSTIRRDPRDTATSPWDIPTPPPAVQLSPVSGSLLSQYMNGAKSGAAAGITIPVAHMSHKNNEPMYRRPQPKHTKSGGLDILHKIRTSRGIAAICIAVLVVIALGIGVFVFRPQIATANYQSLVDGFVTRIEDYRSTHNDRMAAEIIARRQNGNESEYLDIDLLEDPFALIMERVREYNRRIMNGGQPVLEDPFSYGQDNFNLVYFGFEEEMIGFISIPSIEARLPIFMGASRENLHRGLAHLTGTSLPIGGESTNAVIAGHMTSGRNNMLTGIDDMEIGDELRITNFYDTLVYTIVDIQHVHPLQTEVLAVQNGRDLITLLAYQEGNPQRYMIVAERRP